MIDKIDIRKCTGCRRCVDFCPMDVLRLDTCTDEIPACQKGCPAGADMRGYFYLMNKGDFYSAIASLREALVLPAVTGYVCYHPCETACSRKDVDSAVNINALERFIALYWLGEKAVPVVRTHTSKVAVIGSGPAGLAAAYYLVQMGYPVTVFESKPQFGGLMRYGIPERRLPRHVLDAQVDYIRDSGAELIAGVTIGKDASIESLKEKDYKAFFVATGIKRSWKPGKLPATGMEVPESDKGYRLYLSRGLTGPAAGEFPLQSGLKLTPEGALMVQRNSLYTGVPGLFAGGDAVNGPTSVVEAVASGKKAAFAIDCYLKGMDLKAFRIPLQKNVKRPPKEGIEKNIRQETKGVFDEETALAEADRCMTCGSKSYIAYYENCMTCYNCETGCPYHAVTVDPIRKTMPVLITNPGDKTNYSVLYTAKG